MDIFNIIKTRKDHMRKPKWYVSSTMFWGLPPEKWFELAKSHELKGLEIWTQQMITQEITPEKIKKLKDFYGLSITAHSYSWDMNLISLSKPMRRAAMKLTRRGIDLAADMEAEQITVHPGREGLPLCGIDLDKMQAAACTSIGQYGERKGVSVSFEIMEKIPKERFTSSAAMKQVEMHTDKDICWGYTEDIAHCDSEEEIFQMAEDLKEKLLEFHVSNKKGKVRHISDVRDGDFQLPEIAKRLTHYGVPMVLEGYDPFGQAERFENTWDWLTKA